MTAVPASSPTSQSTQICLRGHLLTMLPAGALWWPERRTLIVSDLHLEKGSSFARRGQMLPPYDTSATLRLVEALVADHAPECVISLGDSFHDPSAEGRLSDDAVARICALTAQTDWVWVEGNHDPDPPAYLGGRAAKTLYLDDLIFRHEPSGELGEIAGHLHPCARIASKTRTLRRRCFIGDGERLILPALGAFTGGLNVLEPAFASSLSQADALIFALGRNAVIPISKKRLVPDRGHRRSNRWRIEVSAPSLNMTP